jgi:hypothetical protein
MKSKTLGIIDEERLKLLPADYWAAHEFCFFLHDKILGVLAEYDSHGVQNIVTEAFRKVIVDAKKEKEFDGINLLAYMKERNLIKPYKYHIISHAVMALTSDMLHFLYEALKCLEKRKLSVAFSLLRKPLKEHLFFLSWILADEDDFISRFECNNYNSFDVFSKEQRLDIIKNSISKLYVKEAFKPDIIWEYIYSKNQKNGFEVIWQRATHLTTSHGELLKTGDYSFNFVFEDPSDDSYYFFLKDKLPYLFLYLTQVVLTSFHRVHPINEKTVSHLILTTMGCYESLFIDGRGIINRVLQKAIGDILKCVHCNAPFKINKTNASMFYLHESFYCKKCGLISEFPLYWILAKGNLKVI